jgi:hypothetical protein
VPLQSRNTIEWSRSTSVFCSNSSRNPEIDPVENVLNFIRYRLRAHYVPVPPPFGGVLTPLPTNLNLSAGGATFSFYFPASANSRRLPIAEPPTDGL